MGYIVSCYSQAAFKEFILPSEKNADYSITIRSNYFGIKDDIKVQLEVLDGKWKIKRTRQYSIVQDNHQKESAALDDQVALTLNTVHQDEIFMFVRRSASSIHPFNKYILSGVNEIRIGKNDSNDICYDFRNMVSREHARIGRSGDRYILKNYSQNGVYVNSTLIMDEIELDFGAYINILGLHIVYLGEIIAVDTDGIEVSINENILKPITSNEDVTVYMDNREKKGITGGITYHRAPRNYEKLDSDTVEIE